MLWQETVQLTTVLETVFQSILQQRMQDMPLLNHALSVEAFGFRQINGEWLGILITPWFMNLLLLPGLDNDWSGLPPGAKFNKSFPYGVFEFTLAIEEQLGAYAQCSLFSPMFQFTRQIDAQAAAQAALRGLLAGEKPSSLSRRDLLRGALSKDGA